MVALQTTFSSNYMPANGMFGGALFASGGGSLVLDGSTFVGNRADGGGAVLMESRRFPGTSLQVLNRYESC